jgi:hypothetical protein
MNTQLHQNTSAATPLTTPAPAEWPVLPAFVMGFPLVAASSQLFRGNDTTQAETQ